LLAWTKDGPAGSRTTRLVLVLSTREQVRRPADEDSRTAAEANRGPELAAVASCRVCSA